MTTREIIDFLENDICETRIFSAFDNLSVRIRFFLVSFFYVFVVDSNGKISRIDQMLLGPYKNWWHLTKIRKLILFCQLVSRIFVRNENKATRSTYLWKQNWFHFSLNSSKIEVCGVFYLLLWIWWSFGSKSISEKLSNTPLEPLCIMHWASVIYINDCRWCSVILGA